MKKSFSIFILFLIILSSCNNSDNKSDSDTNSTSIEQTKNDNEAENTDIEKPEIFLPYQGKPTFENFIYFFEEKTVPFESHSYFEEPIFKGVIPKEFSSFTGVDVEDYKYIMQMGKFEVNNKICLLFVTCDLEEIGNGFICTYNKNGELIASHKFDFYSFYQEHTFFKVDKYNNVFVIDKFMERGQDWSYQNNGTASLMSYTDYSYSEIERYSIQENGEILDGVPILDVVESFLDNLDSQNFKAAFDLQNNPDWGDYESFSSSNAFGAIVSTNIDSLNILSSDVNSAEIYCSAKYIDTINGNSDIQQKFILTKKDNIWLITKMKVIDFERTASYYCEDFLSSELHLSNITDEKFGFSILVVSGLPEDSYNEKYAGEIWGDAKFLTPQHAVYKEDNAQLDFYFTGVTKVKVIETNCEEYRHENISFDGLYSDSYN